MLPRLDALHGPVGRPRPAVLVSSILAGLLSACGGGGGGSNANAGDDLSAYAGGDVILRFAGEGQDILLPQAEVSALPDGRVVLGSANTPNIVILNSSGDLLHDSRVGVVGQILLFPRPYESNGQLILGTNGSSVEQSVGWIPVDTEGQVSDTQVRFNAPGATSSQILGFEDGRILASCRNLGTLYSSVAAFTPAGEEQWSMGFDAAFYTTLAGDEIRMQDTPFDAVVETVRLGLDGTVLAHRRLPLVPDLPGALYGNFQPPFDEDVQLFLAAYQPDPGLPDTRLVVGRAEFWGSGAAEAVEIQLPVGVSFDEGKVVETVDGFVLVGTRYPVVPPDPGSESSGSSAIVARFRWTGEHLWTRELRFGAEGEAPSLLALDNDPALVTGSSVVVAVEGRPDAVVGTSGDSWSGFAVLDLTTGAATLRGARDLGTSVPVYPTADGAGFLAEFEGEFTENQLVRYSASGEARWARRMPGSTLGLSPDGDALEGLFFWQGALSPVRIQAPAAEAGIAGTFLGSVVPERTFVPEGRFVASSGQHYRLGATAEIVPGFPSNPILVRTDAAGVGELPCLSTALTLLPEAPIDSEEPFLLGDLTLTSSPLVLAVEELDETDVSQFTGPFFDIVTNDSLGVTVEPYDCN